MTRNESRWAQIVFWSIDDILCLHRREIKREAQCDALIKARKSPIELWDVNFIAQMEDRSSLCPYWDRAIQETDRKIRMDKFLRAIYPCWKPIIGQIDGEDSSEFSGMDALHKADLAVFNRGISPNRGNVGRPMAERDAPRDGND